MVKLSDLPEHEQQHLLSKNRPPLGPKAWTAPQKPLSELRVALITTAGLHFREDEAFNFIDATFRPISVDKNSDTLMMSHSSVNFDKTGFIEDINVVFPIDRLRELEKQKKIGFLICKSKLIKFYKKYGWQKYSKKQIILSDHQHNKMFFMTFNCKEKKKIRFFYKP